MDLKEKLHDYREITNQILITLENNKIEELELLLSKRSMIIQEINSYEFDKAEFKNLVYKLDILNMDKAIANIINRKKEELRSKIQRVQQSKKVTNSYKSVQSEGTILSRKY